MFIRLFKDSNPLVELAYHKRRDDRQYWAKLRVLKGQPWLIIKPHTRYL